MKDESHVPLLNILLAGVGQALLRSVMSIVLYLLFGAIGLIGSWIVGIVLNGRLVMNGYPNASRQMNLLGTILHTIVILWAYFGFALSPYPIWWPN